MDPSTRAKWNVASLPWQRVIAAIAGAILVYLGLRTTLLAARAPIGYYDEGLILTDSYLLLLGKFPYRDFYTSYAPGIFASTALLFEAFGASVATERVLGLLTRLVLALSAGRLAGRLAGKQFSLVTAGAASLWLSLLGMAASAWLAALAVGFLSCEAWLLAHARRKPFGYGGAGVLIGSVSYFRHDLFVYLLVALAVACLVWLARSPARPELRQSVRACAWTGAGLALSVALFWIPVIAIAGAHQLATDVFFDQIRHVMPARRMGFPNVWRLEPLPPFPLGLPALLRNPYPSAVVLSLVALPLALLAWLRPLRFGVKSLPALVWVAALGVAVLPQMLRRTDFEHAVGTVMPALTWLAFLSWGGVGGPRSLLVPLRATLGVLFLLLPVREQFFAREEPAGSNQVLRTARAKDIVDPVADARHEVLSFLHSVTMPGEPIFVGSVDHRWIFVNEMDLYFLAERPGAIRYTQFEPNITNRADVQREMIGEMERSRVRAVVLSSRGARSQEPNESSRMGSPLLNEYLEREFRVALRREPYAVLLRKVATTN
jgi:hypothetical protein